MSESYKIGEIANILNIKSYVLRFWESEFPQIKPERTAKGQRLYSTQDLETIKTIQDLLHNQGMTISGAKRVLEQGQDNLGLPNFESPLLTKISAEQNVEMPKAEASSLEAQLLENKKCKIKNCTENLVQSSLIFPMEQKKELNSKNTSLLSEIAQELQAISEFLGQKI